MVQLLSFLPCKKLDSLILPIALKTSSLLNSFILALRAFNLLFFIDTNLLRFKEFQVSITLVISISISNSFSISLSLSLFSISVWTIFGILLESFWTLSNFLCFFLYSAHFVSLPTIFSSCVRYISPLSNT